MAAQNFLSRVSQNNVLGNLLRSSDSFLDNGYKQTVLFEQGVPAFDQCKFYKIDS